MFIVVSDEQKGVTWRERYCMLSMFSVVPDVLWMFNVVADGPQHMMCMRRVRVPFTLLSRLLQCAACVTRCDHRRDVGH